MSEYDEVFFILIPVRAAIVVAAADSNYHSSDTYCRSIHYCHDGTSAAIATKVHYHIFFPLSPRRPRNYCTSVTII